jgi:hypothetical protein
MVSAEPHTSLCVIKDLTLWWLGAELRVEDTIPHYI